MPELTPAPKDSLQLDERQRAMLQAMGVTHWWPETPPQTREAAVPLSGNARDAATHLPSALPDSVAASQPSARPTVKTAQTPASDNRQSIAETPISTSDNSHFDSESASTQAIQPIQGAVDEMDWDTLERTISQCRACALCEGRTQTVAGTGPRQARWMVVGEAPGEQEDRQGLPFVGPAGQLLDAMLAAMGLSRDRDVYIANVIKCRPPHNRNPEPAEVARCEPYLRRQMALVQPDLVLAMGKFAAQALLSGVVPQADKAPLGKLRGPVYSVAGIPVVVTYHPSYLLRNPADKAKAWDDLCLAMEHLDHNPLVQRQHDPGATSAASPRSP